MNSRQKHIWIERLTLPKVIYYSVIYGWRSNVQLSYHSVDKLGGKLSGIFKCFNRPELNKGVKDIHGKALVYKIEQDTVNAVEHFSSQNNFVAANLPNNQVEYAEEWQIIYKAKAEQEIRYKADFLCRLDYYYRNKHQDAKIKIILDDTIYKSSIQETFVFDCVKSVTLNFVVTLKSILLSFPLPGSLLICCILAMAGLFKKNQAVIRSKEEAVTVFEEYISNIYARYPEAGHLFWHEASGIPSEQVVMYFDRKDSPLNSESAGLVDQYGMGYLDLPSLPLNVERPFNTLVNVVRHLGVPNIFNVQTYAMWNDAVYFGYKLEYYRQVFSKHNCRIVHQHQEFGPSTLLKALAIRQLDGLFVWNHWSVDHVPVAYFNYAFTDLILSWGAYNDAYFNAHNIKYRAMVQTGMIAGDGISEEGKDTAQEIRTRFSSETKMIIAVLDTSCAVAAPYSVDSMVYFYEQVLDMLDEHPDWGIVIKSKGGRYKNIKFSQRVQNQFDQLIEQKRCVILDGQTRVSIAAMSADISLCYGINTAGIISALTGKRVIHWDLPGFSEHVLRYLGGQGRYIFNTISEVKVALQKVAQDDPIIGDMSEHIGLFDSFADQNGRVRAGQLIGSIMQQFEVGQKSAQVLSNVLSDYRKLYGDNKVTIDSQAKNDEVDQLWADVRNRIRSCATMSEQTETEVLPV